MSGITILGRRPGVGKDCRDFSKLFFIPILSRPNPNSMKPTSPEIPALNGRRQFVKRLSLGSLADMAIPAFGAGRSAPEALPLASSAWDESYWQLVKKQFLIAESRIMFNAANLCPSPYFINEKVAGVARELGGNVSFQYRAVFASQRAKALTQLAQFMGVSKEEIGITRNTSESNSILVNGLEFKPGDEIII